MTGLSAPLPNDYWDYVTKEEARDLAEGLRLYHLRKGAKEKIMPKTLSDIKGILRKYIDTTEQNIEILSLWIIGTYFHSQFGTFPLLQLYAQKRSGKTRTLKLLSALAKNGDGSTCTSPTEALLFRNKDRPLFFDEMENINSKERGAFRETLNAVYKKGNKIIRYHESKGKDGQDYIEKIFEPYYPIALANISGLNDVLADRAVQIILQRSKKNLTRLIEDFTTNEDILKLKDRFDSVNVQIPIELSARWNNFVQNELTDDDELKPIFEKIKATEIYGRPQEIFFPLIIIAYLCDDLDNFLKIVKNFVELREEEEAISDIDEVLKQFIYSHLQEYVGFISVKKLCDYFKNSLESSEEWQNVKWFGRALKRLGLVQKQRVVDGRSQVLLNNNPTNTTNPTKEQNSVGLIGFVGNVGEKKCFVCGSSNANLTQDGKVFYCKDCGYKKFSGISHT